MLFLYTGNNKLLKQKVETFLETNWRSREPPEVENHQK
jgi:hypothetical protein